MLDEDHREVVLRDVNARGGAGGLVEPLRLDRAPHRVRRDEIPLEVLEAAFLAVAVEDLVDAVAERVEAVAGREVRVRLREDPAIEGPDRRVLRGEAVANGAVRAEHECRRVAGRRKGHALRGGIEDSVEERAVHPVVVLHAERLVEALEDLRGLAEVGIRQGFLAQRVQDGRGVHRGGDAVPANIDDVDRGASAGEVVVAEGVAPEDRGRHEAPVDPERPGWDRCRDHGLHVPARALELVRELLELRDLVRTEELVLERVPADLQQRGDGERALGRHAHAVDERAVRRAEVLHENDVAVEPERAVGPRHVGVGRKNGRVGSRPRTSGSFAIGTARRTVTPWITVR